MTARKKNNNGSVDGLSVAAVKFEFSGRTVELDKTRLIQAFYDAPIGAVLGPNARWFVEYDGDMKSLYEIFKVILSVKDDQVTSDMLELFSDAVESLGFTVRDRLAHHIF